MPDSQTGRGTVARSLVARKMGREIGGKGRGKCLGKSRTRSFSAALGVKAGGVPFRLHSAQNFRSHPALQRYGPTLEVESSYTIDNVKTKIQGRDSSGSAETHLCGKAA
ncbi:hypothetical protein CBR_g34628 [Chara braunii]|uniref:Uncharacterized protein n=1 Tax=Chara braunii TaxID=69332 RepID=A0A388LJ41_CHABU|nr:hypothetical protein CBR_g34628 [Chara braunii]|eukprot:GBG82344.1 hypothetical protein CBR_g34628 [Chara braunii]